MTNPEKVFVVIPAFNEERVIRDVLLKLLPFHYNIVVVDDGSMTKLDSLLKNMPVYLLCHPVNLGQGGALQTGIDFALRNKAEYIVTFDADGQHEAAEIEKLLIPLQEDKADIVSGSRFLGTESKNVPAGRKFLLRSARYFNFLFTGLLLSDAHNGLRAMTAKAARKIRLRQNGMAHATEILSEIRKNKLRYAEVPVTIHYTAYSQKKGQSAWSGFRIFFDILLNKIFR